MVGFSWWMECIYYVRKVGYLLCIYLFFFYVTIGLCLMRGEYSSRKLALST